MQLPKEGTEDWDSLITSAFAHVCIDDTEEWLSSRSGKRSVPLTQRQKDILQQYLQLLRDHRAKQLLEKKINPLHKKAVETVNRLALSGESNENLFGLLIITLCCEAEINSLVIPPITYNSALALRSILFWHPFEKGNPRENFFIFDCFRGAGLRALKLLQQRALETGEVTTTRLALNWFFSHKEEYLFQAMKLLTESNSTKALLRPTIEELLNPEEPPTPPVNDPYIYDRTQTLAGDLYKAIHSTQKARGLDGMALLYVSGGLLPYLRTTIKNLLT